MKSPRFHALRHVATALLFLISGAGKAAEAPIVNTLDATNRLVWTAPSDATTNLIGQVEMTTNLVGAPWTPVRYELVSTNLSFPRWSPVAYSPPTNTARLTTVPTITASSAFYRVAVRPNLDSSLMMHLSFDNDFTNGLVLDISGNGNHGYRYEKTRWPTPVVGPDGSQAARFHIYTDGYGTYKRSGDYITVKNAPTIDNLTNATIAVWMYYDKYSSIDLQKQWDSTVLDAGGEVAFSWGLGRLNAGQTYFQVLWKPDANPGFAVKALTFPDLTTDGSTGGWHHYAVTFDGSVLKNYYDGKYISSFTTNGLTKLVLGGTYLGIGCWNFSATPLLYDNDFRPNNGWIEGLVDDIRIYNRAMDATEIRSFYASFDKFSAPTVPTNLWARAAATNQLELRWNASRDNFFVARYDVRRNGEIVGQASGPSYVDQNVIPGATYSYSVEAIDGGGNFSGQSQTLTTNTPAVSAITEVIVDESDGPEKVDIEGTWITATNTGSFGGTSIWGSESRNTKSITFHPTLPGPGDYTVSIWYGGLPSPEAQYIYTTNAPVDIVHSGTTNVVLINQQTGYKAWKTLGTFTFTGNTNELVRIRTDGTAFHTTWGQVVADAVRFSK